MQKPQLYINEKQKDDNGAAGIQEILQPLPCSYAAQGNTLGEGVVYRENDMHRPVARIGRAAVSKTACWGFESLLACHFRFAVTVLNIKQPTDRLRS